MWFLSVYRLTRLASHSLIVFISHWLHNKFPTGKCNHSENNIQSLPSVWDMQLDAIFHLAWNICDSLVVRCCQWYLAAGICPPGVSVLSPTHWWEKAEPISSIEACATVMKHIQKHIWFMIYLTTELPLYSVFLKARTENIPLRSL